MHNKMYKNNRSKRVKTDYIVSCAVMSLYEIIKLVCHIVETFAWRLFDLYSRNHYIIMLTFANYH